MSAGTYKHIVIGKGLMGAAAARHLSADCDGVALIGPDEPPQRAEHQGVFGSHYDEGRITRILDPDPTWALLAKRSIARYREVEQRSGIPFYYEVGHLSIGPEPQSADDYVARVQSVGNALGVQYDVYPEAALAEQFPYLTFAAACVGMYQPHTSGHVSPRSQVRAQATVAAQQGTQVIVETVQSVRQQGDYVEVSTDAGHVYRAAHVLIAAGGFSNTQQLLPRPLEMLVYARTIVLMELGSVDYERLQHMPSIIYKPRDPDERCYILPPIRYPDGKYYLKIGGSPGDSTVETLDELGTWFRSAGREAAAQHLLAKLHRIIPGLQPVAVRTESCVTTFTPSEQIYADKLAGGRIGVLTGGNGSAAKSADEIGRIGALMMQHEQWVYDLDAQQFRARFQGV